MLLMPLPTNDFDPTEAAVTYKIVSAAGHDFCFATPDGGSASADPLMLTGRGLGIWKRALMARQDALEAYSEMVASPGFISPRPYASLRVSDFSGLVLPGGHAPGMRVYLESPELQSLAAAFMAQSKPVAAICHGVLLLARSRDRQGRSVLSGRRVTTLLSSQEMAAYNLTRLWLGTYYRTYPQTTCQAEVVSNLKDPSHFVAGPRPLLRDKPSAMGRGFCVRDQNLLTARWPGDVYTFATALVDMLRPSQAHS